MHFECQFWRFVFNGSDGCWISGEIDRWTDHAYVFSPLRVADPFFFNNARSKGWGLIGGRSVKVANSLQAMEAMKNLVQLSESIQQAATLLADKDAGDSARRNSMCPSAMLVLESQLY